MRKGAVDAIHGSNGRSVGAKG